MTRPPFRIFTDGVSFAWLDDRPAEEWLSLPEFYRGQTVADVPASQGWVELFTDEVASACVEANEGLGEALVAINIALGLPPNTPAVRTAEFARGMRVVAESRGS